VFGLKLRSNLRIFGYVFDERRLGEPSNRSHRSDLYSDPGRADTQAAVACAGLVMCAHHQSKGAGLAPARHESTVWWAVPGAR